MTRLSLVSHPSWSLALVLTLAALAAAGSFATAAEIVSLTESNWDQYAPIGKEVDAIYGDYVLRNDRIVAVIARPVKTRNANLTVKDVGGCVLDLTLRDQPNDQLSAYYPGGGKYKFTSDKVSRAPDGPERTAGSNGVTTGKSVTLECVSDAEVDKPRLTVRYTLTDGQPFLVIETTWSNPTAKAINEELADSIRADRVFEFGNDAATKLFWAYDEWFRQAYGVIADGYEIKRDKSLLLIKDGSSTVKLEPNGQHTAVRRLFPGGSLLDVRSTANRIAALTEQPIRFSLTDPAGPVTNAKLIVKQGATLYGAARTADDGVIETSLPPGEYAVTAEALGRPSVTQTIHVGKREANKFEVKFAACGYVVAKVTDSKGQKIPCKVSFRDQSQPVEWPKDKAGKIDGPARNPYFGPDSADTAVYNVRYTHDGTFRQEIAPGKYDVIISYGPEYDAVFTSLEVVAGRDTPLQASLTRTVDTTGWISADFHSHSSPSGDNASSQLGRVQNLLCEQLEFAPCTEHGRIDSYAPHLKRLGVEHLLATCTGIEVTGALLPVNHQNAFPLIHKPRTQNGGGPTVDINPILQIERLAMWDNKSDKLVQMNHPNLPQILGDKDLDGKPDGGFEKMLGFVDVIEVHPPHSIFKTPEKSTDPKAPRNAAYHWMQMLNLGYRLPGVVNTDAHYNFHDSGWLRNYIKSPTDRVWEIKTMDVVHASEAGNVVMTNGPFLTAYVIKNDPPFAGPGDTAQLEKGQGMLRVRVQCPNWLDVNRVQVFLNGRAAKEMNFTRDATPEKFSTGVVKFVADIPLHLKTDTHILVATIGEGLGLGPVMGPTHGKDVPCALTNPIYVDVDGDGFKPNGDQLDYPLPLAK